jgi:hypothetical protein
MAFAISAWDAFETDVEFGMPEFRSGSEGSELALF